ncbi:hypothetical protein ACTFIR_008935 [Dictyostelium discoideum]
MSTINNDNNNNNLEIIKKLLSPKEFRKCDIIFNGDKKFKNEWNCFTNQSSWIQFFNDILLLCNEIRSAVLIDYNVPEWEELSQFLNHIKSNPTLIKILPQLSNIKLIYLDDFLFFLINNKSLIDRSEIDINNSFSNYLFIDVSLQNSSPIICNDNLSLHKNLLLNLISILKLNNNNNNNLNFNFNLNEFSNELNLKNIYFPILSGWLCEYPIIYCNSGNFKNCGLINYENVNQQDLENNNLCGIDLIKVEVQLNKPFNNDILKIQSIQRVCAFTFPLNLNFLENSNNNNNQKENEPLQLINYEKRIKERFNNNNNLNFKELWNDISFLKQTISMATIRL